MTGTEDTTELSARVIAAHFQSMAARECEPLFEHPPVFDRHVRIRVQHEAAVLYRWAREAAGVE